MAPAKGCNGSDVATKLGAAPVPTPPVERRADGVGGAASAAAASSADAPAVSSAASEATSDSGRIVAFAGTPQPTSSPATSDGVVQDGDESKLCSLALRVPKPGKTSDETAGLKRQVEHRTMQKIVQHLWVHRRDLIQPSWGYLENDMVKVAAPDSGTTGEITTFDPAPKTIKQIPPKWKGQFMVDRMEGMSADMIARVDDKDSKAIEDLFQLLTKTTGTDVLPAMAASMPLTARVMTQRIQETQRESLLKLIPSAVNAETGEVNWSKLKLYTPIFCPASGKAQKLKHICGDDSKAIPKHIVITKEFKISNPVNDNLAHAVFKGTKHHLASLFTDSSKPNLLILDKSGEMLKTRFTAMAEVMEAERLASLGNIETTDELTLVDKKLEKRTRLLEKARATRQENAAKKPKLEREVSLG